MKANGVIIFFVGYGIYYFSKDKAYFGEWKNKKKEGFGEFIWPDRKYIGFYLNDKKMDLAFLLGKMDINPLLDFGRMGSNSDWESL